MLLKYGTIINICAFRDRNRFRLPRRAHLEDLGLSGNPLRIKQYHTWVLNECSDQHIPAIERNEHDIYVGHHPLYPKSQFN